MKAENITPIEAKLDRIVEQAKTLYINYISLWNASYVHKGKFRKGPEKSDALNSTYNSNKSNERELEKICDLCAPLTFHSAFSSWYGYGEISGNKLSDGIMSRKLKRDEFEASLSELIKKYNDSKNENERQVEHWRERKDESMEKYVSAEVERDKEKIDLLTTMLTDSTSTPYLDRTVPENTQQIKKKNFCDKVIDSIKELFHNQSVSNDY